MATKKEAKEAVMGIAKEYGFIQPSSLDEISRINPALRREIEESMLAKDKKIAHSIITLAKNIYSSNARFVFELLQNADDNQFRRARARDELPFIAFHAFPDRIVIECNEDGFTKQNLSAICSVGESTKAASHGYIGAKGIGFKSVFIAAWKVEIQSGNYAFYFKHNREDLGLGMVLPVWQEVDDRGPDSLTRMTLHLHQNGDSDEIEHLHKTIFEQFIALEETSLLFLRNLKEIRVCFYTADEELQESKRFYLEGDPSWKVSLNVESVDEKGEESVEASDYYVIRYVGTGLPKSENREAPATSEAQESSARAETVLAFPVDQENCPILQPQSVFAFLPIRKTSFKFLIQSDFDTNASRQDISESSRRNLKLLDHIASAFCQAVSSFASDDNFAYKWPAYLPSFEEPAGKFWASLPSKISAQISQLPIICTRNNRLKRISDTMIPAMYFMDGDGNVLLDHVDVDPFISARYSSPDQNRLKPYGLNILSAAMVMKLLKKDLGSPLSCMKSRDLSDDIHSRMAKLLTRFASMPSVSPTLRSLELLPLQDGTWVSPNSSRVFFPITHGILIPQSLGFQTLDPIVTDNEDRKAFFSSIGVEEVDVFLARAKAFEKLTTFFITKESRSKDQLVFLYLTQRFFRPEDKQKDILIFCEDGDLRRPSHDDCYFPSNHLYGPKRLLGATDGLPGMQVPFLHSIYLKDTPETPDDSHPSWRRWLQRDIGVRANLRVIAKGGQGLSSVWIYLSEHRADKLFGFLRYIWRSQGAYINEDETRKQCLRETDARRLCRIDLPAACQLQEAYLPFPNLIEQYAQFSGTYIAFPFLTLDEGSTMEEISSNWLFLHTSLGVKKDEDLGFLLDILKWLKLSNDDPSDITNFQHVFSLYSAIQSKLVGTRDRTELRERIKSFFQSGDYILVPECPEAGVWDATWTDPDCCLWEAPKNLYSIYSIEPIYRHAVADESQLSYISALLTETLGIHSASWTDLTNELAAFRQAESQDFASIFAVYKYLRDMGIFLFLEDFRREFRENELIFVPGESESKNGWYKSSECLWSSTTKIRGMVTIQEDYEELKEFFIDTLGVQTLTLQMAYKDLLESSSQVTMDEVISKIWCLNALLSTDDTYVDPRPLLQKSIFPVVFPDGSSALCSADTRFAIPDREHLASRFRGKIKLLDFTQEEVRSLRPFFDWANLSHCYLSASVRELTSISGDTTPFNPSPTRDIKHKAHAIVRPRYHANDAELYELLRTANIEVTETIVTLLRISQGSTPVDVEERIAKLHISEDASLLSIYLPRDRKAQEVCFCDLLPRKVVDLLMRDPVTQILEPFDDEMVRVMIMIFGVHPAALDLVLDREGVAEIEIVNEDIQIDDDFPSEAWDQPGTSDNEDLARSTSADTSISTPTLRNDQPSIRTGDRQIMTALHSSSLGYNRPVPISSLNSHAPEENAHYLRLLNHVLGWARRASFPSSGAFDMSQLRRTLPRAEIPGDYEGFDGPEIRNAFRSDSQLERDKKVGAAGELYAFELLSGMTPPLPGWSQQNWQSTIRRYVTIHPDYATMAPWYGRETSDIVYDDTEGAFTSLLISHGYLEADEWEDRRPRYFIEIKTTTGPLGTPFYMSKRQFERMGNMHNSHHSSDVYLIIRVFDIRGPDIGMCVYLDPEQLRLDGGLVFTGETWSVVPG
ncbi:hypothetical protein N7478_010755 [Penicillium angulare]|uniref:uncharacterized protein n=1 Tax=Penicillium angulare TaxID=116970 RepID=UPI00254147AC|nr:uncharacterized protein N7478_010755 [Penicillium angulare]KAJ5263150.1 hypothetical protein N7478_010755 [Penicillium angulare]